MLIDVVFQVYVNAMWDLYVKNDFQFNKQNQKGNGYEIQIKRSCVTTIERLELFVGQRKQKYFWPLDGKLEIKFTIPCDTKESHVSFP